MTRPDTPWFTASRSAGNGGQCVEVRRHAGHTEVRDSKDRTGPVLTFAPDGWGAFTTALRHDTPHHLTGTEFRPDVRAPKGCPSPSPDNGEVTMIDALEPQSGCRAHE